MFYAKDQFNDGYAAGKKEAQLQVENLMTRITGLQAELGKAQDENVNLKRHAEHNPAFQTELNQLRGENAQLKASLEQAKASSAKIQDGALSERQRISFILNHPSAKGRSSNARMLALETSMSAEEAVKVMAALPITEAAASKPSDQAIKFAIEMANTPNPKLGPWRNDDEQEPEQHTQNTLANIARGNL